MEIGGEVEGVNENGSDRVLHLPAGTVLAYQVIELAVSNEGDVRAMVSHGSSGGFHLKVSDSQTSIASVALDVLHLGMKRKRSSKGRPTLFVLHTR